MGNLDFHLGNFRNAFVRIGQKLFLLTEASDYWRTALAKYRISWRRCVRANDEHGDEFNFQRAEQVNAVGENFVVDAGRNRALIFTTNLHKLNRQITAACYAQLKARLFTIPLCVFPLLTMRG